MNKLELKHLAPYLPFKLNLYWNTVEDNQEMWTQNIDKVLEFVNREKSQNKRWFPILNPLSNLSQNRDLIISLTKLICDIHNDDMDEHFTIKDSGLIQVNTGWDIVFKILYKGSEISFQKYDTWNHCYKPTINTLKAFNLLFKNHYDVFGLIPKGLAIDKNTL